MGMFFPGIVLVRLVVMQVAQHYAEFDHTRAKVLLPWTVKKNVSESLFELYFWKVMWDDQLVLSTSNPLNSCSSNDLALLTLQTAFRLLLRKTKKRATVCFFFFFFFFLSSSFFFSSSSLLSSSSPYFSL